MELGVATLREWLDAGKKVTVLDVRPLNEREEWHIPTSIYADVYSKLKSGQSDALRGFYPDKLIPVVAVCAGGRTSLVAAQLLQQNGFEAYSLQGGMKAWSLAWNTAKISFHNFEVIQFRRTGKGCLSYLIASKNEAVVIDASLPVEVYQKYLSNHNLHMKFTADTHLHADHLSRSGLLAEAAKVPFHLYSSNVLRQTNESDVLKVGDAEIKVLFTPGHTSDSVCYLINDQVLLSGDTLFVNGVGRPDLKADQEGTIRKSRQLYQSLQDLITLNPGILVMPGHTSKPVDFDQVPISSTLGSIVENTPMLHKSVDEFTAILIQRIPATPANYLVISERNTLGDFSGIDPVELEAGANRCAIS